MSANLTTIDPLEKEEKLLELEIKRFELEQRRSTALSKSAFFPDALKNDVASAVIVYDLSKRMNISVMEVAQSIYIIYNKPSFSTSFLVARLNQSGLIQGSLKTVISKDKQSCYCTAIDRVSGETNKGMTVTMQMAKDEGWISKKGSKWQTMPELMLRKRAQSFFIKEFYPEVMFGLQTQEEIIDAEVNNITQKQPTTQSNGIDLNSFLTENETQNTQPKKQEASQDTPQQQLYTILTGDYRIPKDTANYWLEENAHFIVDILNNSDKLESLVAELMAEF